MNKVNAEKKWIDSTKDGRVVANKITRGASSTRAKKDNLVSAGKTSHQTKGGENHT